MKFNKYDTFSKRFFALIIDCLILSFSEWLLNNISESDILIVSSVVSIFISSFPYLYSILMIGKFGQTLGKMLMGIKVVDNKTENKATYFQAFMREVIPLLLVILAGIAVLFIYYGEDVENFTPSTLGYIIIFLPALTFILWPIIELVTMFMNDKNRAFHDIIADTVVVKLETEE